MQANIAIPQEYDADRDVRRAQTVVCLSKLPPFHPAALKLLNISSDSHTAMDDFEAVFRGDPALAADLLLVANSPLFGNRARIGSIRHALSQLGLDRVRSLGNTIALSFFVRNQPRTAFVRQIWAHSVATAVIAEILGEMNGIRDLYTAGLMHDLGRLGLLLSMGPNYEKWVSAEFSDMEDANRLEEARFGMSHCEAGSHVGAQWGFPPLLRNTMVFHHELHEGAQRDPLYLVQVACRLADTAGFPEVQFAEQPCFPELTGKAQKELTPERIRERVEAQLKIMGR